jgi:acetyl esterase
VRSAVTKLAVVLVFVGLRLTLLVSPRPTALLVRRLFARGDAATAARLRPRAPADVSVVRNISYGPENEAMLDVYTPVGLPEGKRLPTIVWTPGGAFVGGTNKTMDYYFKSLAAAGFAVVSLGYTRAPEATYPTPPRQVITALRYVMDNATPFHVDPGAIWLAGDSAGAHITLQVALALVDRDYATLVGLSSDVKASLRGLILCCGVYDLAALRTASSIGPIIDGVGWAYSGERRFYDHTWFVNQVSLGKHVTGSLPPVFLTVGNSDPLAPQTYELAADLANHAVEVDSLTFEPDHEPALSHEYQFDLDLADARAAFERIVAFVNSRAAQV